LADDLAATNAEYEKLKGSRRDDETPRESPQRQAPGGRGLRRPDLDRWSNDELRAAARDLRIDGADALDREALIECLIGAGDRRPPSTSSSETKHRR
jgi:hypothetical protein